MSKAPCVSQNSTLPLPDAWWFATNVVLLSPPGSVPDVAVTTCSPTGGSPGLAETLSAGTATGSFCVQILGSRTQEERNGSHITPVPPHSSMRLQERTENSWAWELPRGSCSRSSAWLSPPATTAFYFTSCCSSHSDQPGLGGLPGAQAAPAAVLIPSRLHNVPPKMPFPRT